MCAVISYLLDKIHNSGQRVKKENLIATVGLGSEYQDVNII